MSRLKDLYKDEIADAMQKKFGYKNVMEIPKLDKIVINMGVGEAKENAKALESAVKDLETITGQKAVLTKAKGSIANFKIREGMNIGCKVTLRGDKMYEFLDRLVNLALPRVRDFRGVNPNGGIIEKEGFIDASNVMLVFKGKATRVGFRMEGDKKVRFAKATGDKID